MTTAKTLPSNSFHFCLAALVLAFATAANAQTYTVVFNFNSNGGPNDPFFSVIAQGRDGSMYTTSEQGFTGGRGDVFKITPAGTLTVLHEFNGTDGQTPVGGLTLATNGKFYGTTALGGAFGFGTIFSITAKNALKTLYSFRDREDGSLPNAAPIEGEDGNLYGTASSCTAFGVNGSNGCETANANKFGAVYKITPSGEFSRLHTFDGTDGANPIAALVQASDGNFYGTTVDGGTHGLGVIFRMSPSGKFKVLFNFDSAFGAGSVAPLIQGSDGNLYGVTSGASGGTVFRFTCSGVTILHNFAGGSDGTNPIGGLVQATDGNFYGTNDVGPLEFVGGVIFRISPKEEFATLHEFDFTTGGSAQTTLLQHTNGLLYGETCCGGSFNVGVFYSLNAGLRPFASFLPAIGHAGKTIDILGQGFTGTTRVSFHGKPAQFKVVSDTFLTATVPKGATSGFVTVTTPKGTLTSNKKFQVSAEDDDFQHDEDGDRDQDGRHDERRRMPLCEEQDHEHRRVF
jgi:uncharacterized repeat protein (TIGR03803 family)